jgi:hypothetical protein
MSGNRRDGNDTRCARPGCCQRGPQPASRRPLRRAPPRYAVGCRCRRPGGAAVARSIRTLHHRQSVSRGTHDAAFGVSKTKESASSPPGFPKSPLFPIQRLRRGGKQKTPPERGLGRGSINSNFGRPLSHSASTRARARVTQCEARGVPILTVDHAVHVGALVCHGRRSLREGGGV